ncbi:MAG: hypothetical protein Q7N50_15495 [Armatimonadota bacterium]|nr:hypothetical protein [Armatimonadota bacterium]
MTSNSLKQNYPEGDARHLDDVDEILRKPNLCSTLEILAPLAIFTDPVLGMPHPLDYTDESDGNDIAATLRNSLHLWHVAYFAKAALLGSNPYRKSTLTFEQIIEAVNHYNQYDMPLSSNPTDEEILQATIRMAYQQFPYQNVWWGGMNAARFIYRKLSQTSALSLHERVIDLFGVEYNLLLDICVCLYMAVHNHVKTSRCPSFSFTDISHLLRWWDPPTLHKVIDGISQTQNEFRVNCEVNRSTNPNLRKYDFNPLLFKPVVRIGKRYYIPIPAMILLWATEGIHYRLSEHAKNIVGNGGAFFGEFGHAFESFVADLLDCSCRRYIPEALIRNNKQKAADFVLLEGNRALIIECKTKRRHLKHKYGVIDAIDNDYKEVVHGLKQCISTETLIRNGTLKSPQFPELNNISEFFYAVVTLGDFYQANSYLMQDRIRRALGVNLNYQVLSSRELELMLANLKGLDIIPFMTAKAVARNPRPTSYKDDLYDWLAELDRSDMNDPSEEIALALIRRLRDRIANLSQS